MAKTKTETIETGLRIPVDLYEELKRLAQEAERSLNAEIIFALKKHVEKQNVPSKK
jgi:hypothetical protein